MAEPPILTPHGANADAAAADLIDRAFRQLRRQGLVPVETIALYVTGDYGRGEGWVAEESGVWVPYGTPDLVVLLPITFEEEAAAAQAAIDQALVEVCTAIGYSLRIRAITSDSLLRPGEARFTFSLLHDRKVWWSMDGHDPFRSSVKAVGDTLAAEARAALVELGAPLRDLEAMQRQPIAGYHTGMVRLAFIRCIEIMSGLGDITLMHLKRYVPRLAHRRRALAVLAAEGLVHPQLAAVAGAAYALRLLQPRPQVPSWGDLQQLGSESLVWARHVAHTYLGAELVDPAA